MIQTRDPSQLASGGMSILYGVDVSASLYLQHPEVLEAAHYAAQCHAGQVRLTGELYVAHVVETAKIVEALLPRVRDLICVTHLSSSSTIFFVFVFFFFFPL